MDLPPHVPPPPDTNPNGWDDHRWLARTWEAVQEVKATTERTEKDVRAMKNLIVQLDKTVAEGFRRFGYRLREAEGKVASSQVDAQEARQTAREVESTAVRTFVQDAKPFGRWRRDLVVFAMTVAATLAAGAIAHACGFAPLG